MTAPAQPGERFRRVEELFHAALALPRERRPAFLDGACGTDEELRAGVEALLHADESDPTFAAAIGGEARLLAESVAEAPQLSPGARLGRYEIVAPLGAGGMGEVWRARDGRLGREVAIKVLPRRLTVDPAALQRFEREARAVAALSHPNILAIHDFERDGETFYAVTELLEGESLRERLRGGPAAPRKVREWGTQLARALAAAHDRGIVHRDVKPENVFLTTSGIVKLLDFGLARPQAGPQAETAVAGESSLTTAGMLVGTVGYIAPEQLRGEAVDARADVFALGCVLYELLTGERAFAARSPAEVLSAILEHDPPRLETLAETASPELARIVRRCLEKRREQRFQSAHDLAFALEGNEATSAAGRHAAAAESVTAAQRARWRWALPAWIAWSAAAAAVVATALATWLALSRSTPLTPGVVRFSIAPPAGLRFDSPWINLELSPDGRAIAFTAARANEPPWLWVRFVDGLEPRLLAGSEGAALPFWAPDGRSLGFFAGGKLKRVEADGSGPPTIICDAPDGRGGAWSQHGEILFAPDSNGALYRVSATGGEPTPVTRLERGAVSHRLPTFLADGRRFLYLSVGSAPPPSGELETLVGALDDPRPRPLLRASSVARVVPGGGYVVFTREQTVLTQRLDDGSARLLGEPQPIDRLSLISPVVSGGPIIAAAPGLLAFGSEPRRSSRLQWLDGGGAAGRTITVPAGHALQSLSPDARYAVLELQSATYESDLWVVELEGGVITRLTHEPGVERWPSWSPDGRRVAYTAYPRGAHAELHARSLRDPERDELLWRAPDFMVGGSRWSSDGHLITFHQKTAGSTSRFDLWYLPLAGSRRPLPHLRAPFNETFPVLSPDGRLLAYFSDESETMELYVQLFPERGERIGVSTGASPPAIWSADGRQLVYGGRDGDPVAVEVQSGAELRASPPRILVDLPPNALAWARAADGRLLVQVADAETAPASLTVVANWPSLLERAP